MWIGGKCLNLCYHRYSPKQFNAILSSTYQNTKLLHKNCTTFSKDDWEDEKGSNLKESYLKEKYKDITKK